MAVKRIGSFNRFLEYIVVQPLRATMVVGFSRFS